MHFCAEGKKEVFSNLDFVIILLQTLPMKLHRVDCTMFNIKHHKTMTFSGHRHISCKFYPEKMSVFGSAGVNDQFSLKR